MPLITLTSATDTVVLYGDDPYASGFTYRNDTLSEWYAFAGADAKSEKRPNGPGAFGFGKLYANPKALAVKGSFWGASQTEAAYARRRLTGLFADGNGITMTVVDELGTWTRRLHLLEADVPFLPYPNFEFTLNLEASDPKRYGPTQLIPIAVPSPSSGLIWPLGTAASGLYFDWGTAGTDGRGIFTNIGNASTIPSFGLDGGGIANGFRITEVETGRELTYSADVVAGIPVFLNGVTQGVQLGGSGDYRTRLTRRGWPTIPPSSTRTYQFTPLGAVTGTPVLTMSVAIADL
jgi:hypothetical protein